MHDSTARLFKAIQIKRKMRDLPQPGEVAQAMGVQAAVVTNWAKRGVSKEGRLEANALYGINPNWIATGEGDMEPVGILARLQSGLPVAGFNEPSNVTPLVARAKVPLISWVQAGEPQDVFDFFEPGEAVRWEDAIESKPSKHGYALLVEGDSMVSNMGGHSFPSGTVLIVDPERHATANSYVIAKDVGTQKATFKQLVTDGARWYLKALNTQYPTIEIDDPNLRVIGVVLEAKPPSVKLA